MAVTLALTAVAALRLAAQAPDVAARLTGRVPPAVVSAVAGIAASAADRGVPVEPLVQKAIEGGAKGKPADRVIAAVRALADQLAAAAAALGSGGQTDVDVVEGGAYALGAGLGVKQVQQLARASHPPYDAALTLRVAATLAALGVPPKTTVDLLQGVISAGRPPSELLDLPRGDLLSTGASLRAAHWRLQRDAGLDLIPSNDFSYYDRVLDTCALVGAVPARYGWSGGAVDLDTYFAMARGVQAGGRDVTAMEMTKWFDTNYHYLVPEFDRGQAFRLASTKPVDEFQEAKALGFHTKPVLLGPVTFLLLGKTRAAAFDRLELLDALLPVYGAVLARLAAAGATWVQLDEPSIAVDRTPQELAAYGRAYRFLTERAPQLKLLVATYFAELGDSLATARRPPVAGLHVDVVRAPRQLDPLLKAWPKGRVLSLGVVDGRNVWRADLAAALGLLERARERIGADELWVAPSCSLLHVPVDLDLERRLDPDLKGWLAFAKQKLAEVATLTRAVRDGRQAVAAELEANARAIAGRRSSRRIHDPAVKQRAGAVGDRDLRRASPHAARRKQQLRLRSEERRQGRRV